MSNQTLCPLCNTQPRVTGKQDGEWVVGATAYCDCTRVTAYHDGKTLNVQQVADRLASQQERLAELREEVAEARQRNRDVHRRLMEEQKVLERELERVRSRLETLATARH